VDIRKMIVHAALLMGGVSSVASAERDTLWRRTLSGTGNGDDIVVAMACDSSGNILAAILGLEGTYGSFPTIRTAKYSPQGELLWTRRFAGSSGAVPAAIAVNWSGSVFVSGTCARTSQPTDIVTIAYAPDGDSLWAQCFDGGVADSATSITIGPAGEVAVSGISQVGGEWCSAIAVYSYSGQLSWSNVRNVGDSLDDRVYASVFDPAGYIYQVGQDGWRAFAQQYTASGEFRWERLYYVLRGRFRSCAVDYRGNLVAAGGVEGDVNVGLLTMKFSRSGGEIWDRWFTGDPDYSNFAAGVETDVQDNVYVGGNLERGYLVLKYDTSGTLLWFRRSPEEAWDSVCGFGLTPDGAAYVSYLSSVGQHGEVATAVGKYSLAGDSLWTRIWQPGHPYVDVRGNVLVLASSGLVAASFYPWSLNHGDCASAFVHIDSGGVQQWTKEYNLTPGPGDDAVNDVAFDQQGNVVVVGRLDMTDDFYDIGVAKYSSIGELLWWRNWNPGLRNSDDEAFYVAVDSQENIVVLGTTQADTASASRMVTLKYDPAGNLRWVNQYEGEGLGAYCADLALDRDGNVMVLFGVVVDSGERDFATLKYSASGESLWERRYGGAAHPSLDYPRALAIDDDRSVYVTGGTYEAESLRRATTIKYASDGTRCWVAHTSFASAGLYLPACVDIDIGGGVRVAGVGCDPDYRLFAAKYGASGETLWTHVGGVDTLGYFSIGEAAFDASGRAFLVCDKFQRWTSTVALDSGGGEMWRRWGERCNIGEDVTVAPEGTVFAAYGGALHSLSPWGRICAYDSLGVLRWADSTSVEPYAIAAGPAGRVAAAGRRGGMSLTLYAPVLGVEERPLEPKSEGQLELMVSPNPFSARVRIRSVGFFNASVADIFDCLGRRVRTVSFGRGGPPRDGWTWDGTDDQGRVLAAGIYILRLSSKAQSGIGLRAVSGLQIKLTKLK